jgi:hypothetical protein
LRKAHISFVLSAFLSSHISAASTGRISVEFETGTLETLSGKSKFVSYRTKNIRQFTSRPKYVYGCRRNKLTIKEFFCNTQWRNIVDSDWYINNKYVTNCNVFTAILVQRTRHMLRDTARLIFITIIIIIIIIITIFLYIIASNSVGHMKGSKARLIR